MCGITCAFDLKEDSSVLRPQLLEMSKKLRHRGPDWSGIYSDNNAILSHERLAIVDPASGKQPLYGQNDDVVLAVNGLLALMQYRMFLSHPSPYTKELFLYGL